MDNLLIFFAIPVATIIFSIVLQKLLNSPILVAATIFAILLLVTFSAFDSSFLVYAILYSILAFITAIITRFVCCLIRNSQNPCIKNSDILGISDVEDILDTNNNSNNCCCNNRYLPKRFVNNRRY